jgi:hypothetical protein
MRLPYQTRTEQEALVHWHARTERVLGVKGGRSTDPRRCPIEEAAHIAFVEAGKLAWALAAEACFRDRN